ncbi:porin OmpC [Pantoea sp. BAV 3049]|uniref:porin OmpC n=1 Tax=Pantoea sp. BAV 3049 TaxID=2654188 RepID=UPI00131A897E|nr:porin OmpC [Pantoea sp. BAV 3049]
MKKSALAILTAALALTTAAQAAEVYNKDDNKLDLYGKIKGLHYFSDSAGNDGDKSYMRMGFKGQTQINDLMTGYGQWEYQFNTNNSESDSNTGNKTRLGFAGLKFGNYGSVDYGRNYGVLYDVEAWTDMFPEFGGDGTARSDNFMTQRTTGVATYRNTNFFGLVDGLKFALQYQGKNDDDTGRTSANKGNGDGYGMSAVYALGDSGVSISGAYTSSDRTDAQQAQGWGHGDKADSWGTGLKYDANSVYLAAIYTETRNMTPISGTAVINNVSTSVAGAANKAQNIELVAQYQFDFGLRPSLGYVQTKGKDIEGIGDVDLVKYIDVGATYYFNKNMNTYVDYKINQLDDDNKLALNNDDVVAVGLVYQF